MLHFFPQGIIHSKIFFICNYIAMGEEGGRGRGGGGGGFLLGNAKKNCVVFSHKLKEPGR